jgi:1L-myo-inositol 1-phosphate cytidylyltransferase
VPRSRPVTQTIILAAGHGSRLVSGGVPKPLVQIAGVPLIGHALEHARASGCTRAVVVIGHEGDQVRAAIERMQFGKAGVDVAFIVNPHTDNPNGVSLLTAQPLAEEAFFLQMVDHVFGGVALPKLTEQVLAGGEVGRLLVDKAPNGIDVSDATKVRLDGERIIAIGKQVEPWDAIDTGCFVLTRAAFEALRRVGTSEPLTVSAGMRQLTRQRLLGAVSIDGIPWVDVDTPADREAGERLLKDAQLMIRT